MSAGSDTKSFVPMIDVSDVGTEINESSRAGGHVGKPGTHWVHMTAV